MDDCGLEEVAIEGMTVDMVVIEPPVPWKDSEIGTGTVICGGRVIFFIMVLDIDCCISGK